MNEQAPEIGIATFTNAPKHGLAARGMLPRHQPEPRGEIAPLRKRRAVADGGDEGRRRERADARHLHEPIAGLIVTREAEDCRIDAARKSSLPPVQFQPRM